MSLRGGLRDAEGVETAQLGVGLPGQRLRRGMICSRTICLNSKRHAQGEEKPALAVAGRVAGPQSRRRCPPVVEDLAVPGSQACLVLLRAMVRPRLA